MLLKRRQKSKELQTLQSLNARMRLSSESKQYYLNLEKGFEGEQMFDQLLTTLSDDWLIINDLLLKNNNAYFQLDSLLISQATIYLFEIKNFEGDFYFNSEKWYSKSKKEIKNPLLQLNRNESSLRQLLQELGLNFTIEPYLIFINPEFTLYQAPLEPPIIFPTQLNNFLKKLHQKQPRIKERHVRFAQQLVSEHQGEYPFSHVPDYNYEQLKKGILCSSCNELLPVAVGKKFVCPKCGCIEDLDVAVMRSAAEFKLLFPDKRVTTNEIFDWCNVLESKKTVRRVLGKNMEVRGHGKYTYYINT